VGCGFEGFGQEQQRTTFPKATSPFLHRRKKAPREDSSEEVVSLLKRIYTRIEDLDERHSDLHERVMNQPSHHHRSHRDDQHATVGYIKIKQP
jgi:hypothetical protein